MKKNKETIENKLKKREQETFEILELIRNGLNKKDK